MAQASDPHPDRRVFATNSAEETGRLGEALGRRLDRTLVLALIGPLGSGKTAFVQGLARGLEVPAGYAVTSPSYTLIHEYPGRLPLAHIDLYRLASEADLDDLGLAEILDGQAVCAVEWAERLQPGAVSDRLEIRFEFGDGNRRTIGLQAYGQAARSLVKAMDSWRA